MTGLDLNTFLQILISGLLMGALYALVASGLSLIQGLMNIINFCHGDLVTISMYTSFLLWSVFKMDPLVSIPVCIIVSTLVGIATHKLIISQVLRSPSSFGQMFSTYGLGILIASTLQFVFTPNYRSVLNPFVEGSISIGAINISKPLLFGAVGALLAYGLCYWFIRRTPEGQALQATEQDIDAAKMMGIDTEKMFLLGWTISGFCVGTAGALLTNFYYIHPYVGETFSNISFVVVTLGGYGSFEGSLIAGLIVGVVETISGYVIGPQYKLIPVYLTYLFVLMFRPRGLMGRR
jgi:branched-chain amino acid transport system permease protein